MAEVLLFVGRWGRGNWLRKERKRGKDEEKRRELLISFLLCRIFKNCDRQKEDGRGR